MTGVSAGEGEQQPDSVDEQQLEDSTMEALEADDEYADQVFAVLFAAMLVHREIDSDYCAALT